MNEFVLVCVCVCVWQDDLEDKDGGSMLACVDHRHACGGVWRLRHNFVDCENFGQ